MAALWPMGLVGVGGVGRTKASNQGALLARVQVCAAGQVGRPHPCLEPRELPRPLLRKARDVQGRQLKRSGRGSATTAF